MPRPEHQVKQLNEMIAGRAKSGRALKKPVQRRASGGGEITGTR